MKEGVTISVLRKSKQNQPEAEQGQQCLVWEKQTKPGVSSSYTK